MTDPVGAGDRWIPEEEYARIQLRVPILCVDVALQSSDGGAVGLIRRATYGGGEGWCLVGGSVLRDEPLTSAVLRHVTATLGEGAALVDGTLRLRDVIEYFTDPDVGQFHDPRKHAVALTYSAVLHGEPVPCGEANEFRWFRREDLAGVPFGFGQDGVLDRVLARIDADRQA